jgi:hypothetical protein
MYIRDLSFPKLDEIQPEIDTVDTCKKKFYFYNMTPKIAFSKIVYLKNAEFMLLWVHIIV